MRNVVKNFDILLISLNIPYNYFNNLTTLFSNLYLCVIKFLDILAKSFFLRLLLKPVYGTCKLQTT